MIPVSCGNPIKSVLKTTCWLHCTLRSQTDLFTEQALFLFISEHMKSLRILALAGACFLMTDCRTSTAVGAGAGAVGGGLIGGGTGAAIGAGVGAIGGSAYGKSRDRKKKAERDARRAERNRRN